jgi:hypothetical protein
MPGCAGATALSSGGETEMIHRLIWRRVASLFVIALALASMAGYASAGTTGTMSGTITDAASGKPLRGVSIAAAAP